MRRMIWVLACTCISIVLAAGPTVGQETHLKSVVTAYSYLEIFGYVFGTVRNADGSSDHALIENAIKGMLATSPSEPIASLASKGLSAGDKRATAEDRKYQYLGTFGNAFELVRRKGDIEGDRQFLQAAIDGMLSISSPTANNLNAKLTIRRLKEPKLYELLEVTEEQGRAIVT